MTTQQAQTIDRAYQRAIDHKLSITVSGKLPVTGQRFFGVPSFSEPGKMHWVTIYGGRLVCDCLASNSGTYCIHKALAHQALREEAASKTPASKEVGVVPAHWLNDPEKPFSIFKGE